MWKSRVLSDKEQAVESSRRTRALSRCVEADLTGDERKCPLSLPNLPRHSNPAAAAEDRKGCSTEKAQQERLHPSEGVETGTNAINLEQTIGSFHLEEDVICCGDGRITAHSPFRCMDTKVCRTGFAALGRAHLYRMTEQESIEPSKFRCQGGVQRSVQRQASATIGGARHPAKSGKMDKSPLL